MRLPGHKGIRRLELGETGGLMIIGACLLLGGNGGVTISENISTRAWPALIVAIVPIYIVLLGWLTGMAPRPTAVMWMGLAGVSWASGLCSDQVCMFTPPPDEIQQWNIDPARHEFHLVGRFALFAKSRNMRPRRFSPLLKQMVCGGILPFACRHHHGELPRFHPVPFRCCRSVHSFTLCLSELSSATTAYIWLLRHCDPAKVATYAYVNPIVAVLLGTFFAGETVIERRAQSRRDTALAVVAR